MFKRGAFIAVLGILSTSLISAELLREDFNSGDLSVIKNSLSVRSDLIDDGAGGKCLNLEKTELYLPMAQYFNYKQGTIEFRIKFTGDPAQSVQKSNPIFRARGENGSEKEAYWNSYYCIFGWEIGLFFLICDKNKARTTLNYAKAAQWKQDEWHQIAFTWKVENPGKSKFCFYVDGQIAAQEEKENFEFDDAAWQDAISVKEPKTKIEHSKNSLTIGNLWGTPTCKMALDDLKFYDNVRVYGN